MDSPELETRSSLDLAGVPRRGPHPNRDYKRHFNRQKERFDAATTDQAGRKKELGRASQKQLKLQEEIEFLLDAIAGERHRRQQIQDDKRSASSLSAALDTLADAADKEDVKPVIAQKDDIELEELLDDVAQRDRPAQQSHETASTAGSSKRQRRSSTDTDDELLEAAGVTSKRARND